METLDWSSYYITCGADLDYYAVARNRKGEWLVLESGSPTPPGNPALQSWWRNCDVPSLAAGISFIENMEA
jgi:hypothetical protein